MAIRVTDLMLFYLLQDIFVVLRAGPGCGLVLPVLVFGYDEADCGSALACL
jgi:hypothetical protein